MVDNFLAGEGKILTLFCFFLYSGSESVVAGPSGASDENNARFQSATG
jgi:hypothetical protein